MMHLATVTALVFLGLSAAAAFDMIVDLRSGNVFPRGGRPAGIEWVVKPTRPSGDCTCDARGVLKLTFNDEERRFMKLGMLFSGSSKFSFNIGDSRTNNGWAGDANTQTEDAEVHAWHQTILVYGKDDLVNGGSYGQQTSRGFFLNGFVEMTVGNNYFWADNGVSSPVTVNNNKIFAMHPRSENYDVYLAMNRVVQTENRDGSGLCLVLLTWSDQP